MQDPKSYEDNKSAAKRDADEHTPELIREMIWGNQNEGILDYGCGAGSVTTTHIFPKAKQFNSSITAVDVSENMIEHAKKTYSHPKIQYIIGNIMSDDFILKDKRFDKIFSIYVLHFIKDYRQAFKNFYNLLNPNGQFGFTVVTDSYIFKMLQVIGEDPKWTKYMNGYQEFVPEWYELKQNAENCFKTALESIGFRIKYIQANQKTFYYSSIEMIIDFYISLNPFILKIPENLRHDLREDYRKYYTQFYNVDINSKEGTSEYEMLVCVVEKF